MSVIGNNIKRRRLEKRLTLEDLARAIGTSKQTIQRYESGVIGNIPSDKIEAIALKLDVSPAYLMGWEEITASPNVERSGSGIRGTVPVIDGIAAGSPILADENVVDYMLVTVPNASEHFALVVHGESMIGAGIPDGAKVLVHIQHDAEDGQIVACRVNGDEATLKRFKQKGDTVFLLAENPAYEPYIVPVQDFENGDAEILGVVKQIIIDI